VRPRRRWPACPRWSTFPALPPPLQRAFGLRGRQLDARHAASRGRPAANEWPMQPIEIDAAAAADRGVMPSLPDGFHPSEASYIPVRPGRMAAALHQLNRRPS
jgi:hypothetical protein